MTQDSPDNSEYQSLEIFEDLFYREVESWFSADIACCDECYDEFLACWPAAYFHDEAAFQSAGTPLDVFYSGSRLSSTYTKQQFDDFAAQMGCPNCGHPLVANIWPYELPFSPPKGFERESAEIADIARATPFLVLRHPFARRVLKAIRKRASSESNSVFPEPFYRGRVGSLEALPGLFGPPPREKTLEGRYNHAGLPVLYLASTMKTCLAELRARTGLALIAKVQLKQPLRVLDLVDPTVMEEDVLGALVFSSLLSAPSDAQGWARPQYVFSRFVADCAAAAGFDGILYPSTRIESGCNLMLLRPAEAFSVDWVEQIYRVEDGQERLAWPK